MSDGSTHANPIYPNACEFALPSVLGNSVFSTHQSAGVKKLAPVHSPAAHIAVPTQCSLLSPSSPRVPVRSPPRRCSIESDLEFRCCWRLSSAKSDWPGGALSLACAIIPSDPSIAPCSRHSHSRLLDRPLSRSLGPMSSRKPRRDGDGGGGGGAGWLGALIVGAVTAVAMSVGYLIGREDGREERAEEEATAVRSTAASSSCSSSRNNLADADDSFPRVEPYAGAAATATPSSPSHLSPDDHLCKVCLDEPSDHVFLPCSHQVCCGGCARALRHCPICRAHIQSVIKVFKA